MPTLIIASVMLASLAAPDPRTLAPDNTAHVPCYRDFYSGDGIGCWVVDPDKPWNP